MKKIHLGCGQKYLDGYLNIDFPLSEHTYQTKSIADEQHDILSLYYPTNSIEEIRLHHVFEHFDRPTACALVASWNSWLEKNGILHIEVPDFRKTAEAVLKSSENNKVAIRHIFGSHEASWAIHAEGYTENLLKNLLETFGFKTEQVLRNSWKGTYNIEIIVKKVVSIKKEDLNNCANNYLKEFLLDESELPLLDIWLSLFNKQIDKSWSK